MVSFKHFWVWTAVFVAAVVVILALSIFKPNLFSSSPSSSVPLASAPLLENPETPTQTSAIPKEPDSTYPAPAKKLHKVLTDPSLQPATAADLDEKIKNLDQQLSTIDEQLRNQGIAVPENTKTKGSSQPSDTAARLKALQEHMENRASK